jgi:glycosyltransferase involved in cell wall biosynthesis
VISELLFWLSVAVPVYAYIGYPLVLMALRGLIHRGVKKAEYEPSISLLIPAYNEGDVIERKIQNSLALDYPAHKLEIVVASDGSTDNTAVLAQGLADGTRVRVLAYEQNQGKIGILNAAVPELLGEIIVFSDAAAMIYPNALRRLMSNFADPTVGAVSGKYTVVKADEIGIGKSEDFYWKYETFLKVQESEIASTLGGHGHLHAIRRDLYPFPRKGTINDDYVIPVSVLARQYRAVYEPSAIVYEEAHEMAGFGRRVRIMAGNIQQLREIKGVIRPFRPLPLFFFLSHKVARLLVPFAMAAALILNLFLLNRLLYQAVFALQAGFYLLAIIGAVLPLKPKLLMLPYYFSMINVAVFFAVYHAITSRRNMAWK